MRQHPRNTHTPLQIHPRQVRTHPHTGRHTCTHTGAGVPSSPCTRLPNHPYSHTPYPPRYPLPTYLCILSLPLSLVFSLRKLSPSCRPAHARVHGLMHTHRHESLLASHIWGKEEATGTNMHTCHLPKEAHNPRGCLRTHVHLHTFQTSPRPGTLVFSPESPSQSLQAQRQTENRFASGHTLPALSFTCQQVCTPMRVCPHFPPTYPILPRSCISPHRNSLLVYTPSTRTPTHRTSDMSTP